MNVDRPHQSGGAQYQANIGDIGSHCIAYGQASGALKGRSSGHQHFRGRGGETNDGQSNQHGGNPKIPGQGPSRHHKAVGSPDQQGDPNDN